MDERERLAAMARGRQEKGRAVRLVIYPGRPLNAVQQTLLKGRFASDELKEMLNVRLPEGLRDAVKKLADDLGIASGSDLVRTLLEAALAQGKGGVERFVAEADRIKVENLPAKFKKAKKDPKQGGVRK